ncbi:TPA: hypothetical protein I7709_19850 [Vibrio vulnificus]|uniref:hypothetical protein n=2 Tax=Vibrio vulnificus TaxID=672 RepID=UPI00102AF1C3|nr:hypothetical protein [Vibrio vulnificus]EHK9066792.1 hypothetical protein [Vibrio vulnificus]EHU4801949.1 hypothetical protein [Vibrio vulnificus]EIV8473825.1 hypothetical protein [Vibrio vulnificus]RZQ76691.1 hypothetical protein D8T22_11515 [Vibrio vulnificus]HAS8164940.1 hypothetical protein [Vibrio vulnificus]
MNILVRNISYWYLSITVLSFIAAINTKLIDLALGLIFMWVSFFITITFSRVYDSITTHVDISHTLSNSESWYNLGLFKQSIISWFCSIYAVYFYTGNAPQDVINTLVVSGSLYNDYQQYFMESELSAFSLSKIPAVICLITIKLILIQSFSNCFIYNLNVTKENFCYLLLSSSSFLYFSISRGTSFELFELLFLLWYSLTIRSIKFKAYINKFKVIKNYILLFLVGSLFLVLYSYNISARYSFDSIGSCTSTEMCLDNDAFLMSLLPGLGLLSEKLSGYFLFGIYYLSKLIELHWLKDLMSFILFFIPVGMGESQNVNLYCQGQVDCGANWIPDMARILFDTGFILYILFCSLVMFFLNSTYRRVVSGSNSFYDIGSLFYLFYFFISLPVGNFITISSANVIIVMFFILLNLLRYVIRAR